MNRKTNIKNRKAQSHTMGVLMIYLVTSVLFFMAGFSTFDDSSLISPYFNTDNLNNDNTLVQNNTTLNEFVGGTNQTGANPGTGINIFDLGVLLIPAINILASFIFAVPLTFQQFGTPFPIVLLVGIIPFLMILYGLLGFIRGKDL